MSQLLTSYNPVCHFSKLIASCIKTIRDFVLSIKCFDNSQTA